MRPAGQLCSKPRPPSHWQKSGVQEPWVEGFKYMTEWLDEMKTAILYLWEVSILLAVILATGRVGHLSQEGGGQQEEEAGVLHPYCGGVGRWGFIATSGEDWGGVGRKRRGRYLYLGGWPDKVQKLLRNRIYIATAYKCTVGP